MDDLYLTILNCSWNEWDTENRKLYSLFVLVAQKKTIIGFMGMINVDNTLVLLVRY